MKHVAYVISMPHGLDRWTFREIEALTERSVSIALFPVRYQTGPYMPRPAWKCYRYQGWQILLGQLLALLRWRRRYLSAALEAIRAHALIDFILAAAFCLQMARWQVEHIHCVFGDHKLFIGYFCRQLLGLPLTVAVYGYELKANPNWTMFRRAAAACDAIITNCTYNRDLVIAAVDEPIAEKTKVIRHYADVVPISDTPAFHILIVGGFSQRKGHDVLFSAVRTLREQGRCLDVWVAGYQGPVDMSALAAKFGISDCVRIFEAASDGVVDFLFEACDLFCLPSRTDRDGISEGLPVALIEAMAHGKPVIATALAGTPELVETMLVPENDTQALAKAIAVYMDDPALRMRDGLRNQQIVRRDYSVTNLSAMQRLFEEQAS